jgi:pectate lyase
MLLMGCGDTGSGTVINVSTDITTKSDVHLIQDTNIIPDTMPPDSLLALPDTIPPDSPLPLPDTTFIDVLQPGLCDLVDAHEGWSLCASGPDFCAVVFDDATGCAGVCEALELDCYAAWENAESCAPDIDRPPLSCTPASGHQSDYCVCRAAESTCVPDCNGKACGDDGCGGPCGSCEGGTPCVENQCQCVPKTCMSELMHCGGNYDDGCGGTFSCTGTCPPNHPCAGGFCGGPPEPCLSGDCPAFPGAQGEGMFAKGGRGGDVCHVTSLGNSGTGTLRKCADSQSGPRTVVFDVAGHIQLSSLVMFDKNKLTIAGQTAPGDGIVISGYSVQVKADDAIIQHIRFRSGDTQAPNCPGGGSGFTEDSLTLTGSRIIVDHVSASWGIDENLSGGSSFNDVTVQYSIISEGLYQTGLFHGECSDIHEPGGPKGHSMGGLYKPKDGDGDITIHHNLFAHNGNRNPAIGSYDDDQIFRADIRNNVIYNCPSMGYTSGSSEKIYVNYVGNYGIFGPSSNSDDLFKGNEDNNLKLYKTDNRLDKDKDGSFDGVDHGSSMWGGEFDSSSSPFTFKTVTTHPSEDVPTLILSWAGARPWSRDQTDARVIEDVYNNTGTLIDSQSEVGGVGPLVQGNSITDSDGDGMPDQFEVAYGTNPNNADNNGDIDGDGYSNLENYLHWAARPR